MGEDATRATGIVVGGATAPAVVYGRPLRALWPLDPTIRHLNHGAFGAAPRAVLEEQARWRGIIEANPARFFMRVLPDELRRCAGTQFDPGVVDAFCAVLEEDGPARELSDAPVAPA